MKTEILIGLICIAILTALFLAGCTNHTVKEYLTVRIEKTDGTDITLTYRPEMASWSLLSFTGIEDARHVTPLSDTYIGTLSTHPDPNSINASGDFLGSVIKVILTK